MCKYVLYIIQFHNGYEFLLNDPIWKCTCTHEVVRPGITYESINSQNLLVSRVFELVEPIISGQRSVSGITKSPCCVTCVRNAECERMHKYLSVVQVEEMPFGYVKFLFQQRNIKTLIVCGLTNKHGAFGILGIDITSAPIVDSSQLGCLSLRVCRAAECIRFLFLKKDFLSEPPS
jgi:hypothetical protein